MARAQSPQLLRGKVGNLIHRVMNGKQVVQQAEPEWKAKRRHKNRMADRSCVNRYRDNILEFAGASKIANETYENILASSGDELGPIFRPYSQNHLMAKLREAHTTFREETGHHAVYATEFPLLNSARALRGLDLSRETAPKEAIRMIPIGPHHNPTAIKVLGLEQAADRIPVNGYTGLEFRFHIRQSDLAEYNLEQDKTWTRKLSYYTTENGQRSSQHITFKSDPTDWIPVDIIPHEGFTIDLPKRREEFKYITAIMIEWREVRTVGRRYHRLHDKGIVRIAAVHGPAEAFIAKDFDLAHKKGNKAWKLAPEITNFQPIDLNKIDWREDPQAYIAQAMAKLKPK
jgi:hypothetical protein